MARILPSYTMCLLTVHIKKDFQLEMSRPSEASAERLQREFNLKSFDVDDDGDVKCIGGTWADKPGLVIKDIVLYLSREVVAVRCLRGSTDDCFSVLYRTLSVLYGVSRESTDSGIEYVVYETTTKVAFSAPIYGMFSERMRRQISEWTDLTTNALINPIVGGDWQAKARGLIDIEESRYETLYSGQPSAIVVPAGLSFSIWLPSKFAKMTKYKVSIASESVEDFHDDVYYVQTEFPYSEHVKILEILEGDN